MAATAQTGQGVLAGLKVVELCHLIAGPYCGMLLADEGAEVIKVEPPTGELTRTREPIRTTEAGSMSGYFGSLNRRKESVVLDLKTEAGIGLMHDLLAGADVFITNMRPQALRRLGLHPETLRERYSSLVVASMTGFGLENAGPDANRAGLAMVAEALAGTNGLTRDRSGQPVWCGFALGDIVTGMTAHAGILLALRHRDLTGEGRLVDLALTECTLPLTSVALARVQAADSTMAETAGSNDFHGVPYGTFAARDGFYNLGVNRDDFWARLAKAMGRPELGEDRRYATYLERAKRQAEVHGLVEEWSKQLPRDEVVAAITDADVPVAPVLTMAEVLELEHFHSRGTFVEVDDGIGGTLRQPSDPTGFAVPEQARVPKLGEQRDAVLARLGLTPEQIETLAAQGAFGRPAVPATDAITASAVR
ncbi:CaiB/BaiF CoA transferase family protein [Amycolatopsis acidicola]|uniref:CaiB/BaiF CoA transferase family protein n=1 Tax=Amycolatopsis acidicola TaxID=2596893 RepID=UPI00140A94E3|nr:CoA transferase [Amycolatopsis acidicola]